MLVAGADPSEGPKPNDGPFHLPATLVASQRASIPGFAFPVLPVEGDHQGADLREIGTESITKEGSS